MSSQESELHETPARIELTLLADDGARVLSSAPPVSHGVEAAGDAASGPERPPLLRGTAAMVGSAVVFVVAQAWKLIEASKSVDSTAAAPQRSAVILKDTEASEYTGGESWQSGWHNVALVNSAHVTTTSFKFRIRASTMARPPDREPPLKAGLYIPNLVVEIDEFFQNVLQSVDVGVSLTSWECRSPRAPGVEPTLCVAYVELTVTVSSHLLQTWSKSFTFAIRGDEKVATQI